jgi:serine/threonine protein kinase
LRESKLAASLDHPNVIPIHEAGEAGGVLFIAMRFVEGGDLAARLARDGWLAPVEALSILERVVDALDAAHRRELVHRDVSPATSCSLTRGMCTSQTLG